MPRETIKLSHENNIGSPSPLSLRNSGLTLKASTVSFAGSSRPDTDMKQSTGDDGNYAKNRSRLRRRAESAMSDENKEERRKRR